MDIPNHDELIATIEAFCRRNDMAETRFGRDAIRNPNFIRGLRDGVSPTLDTLAKVRDFMAEVDARAALRAKLDAAPTVPSSDAEEDEGAELPFGTAPVNPTGASSPTCSTTAERQTSYRANGSCRSSEADQAGQGTSTKASCSGGEAA